jgi:DNA-directed RNA polymerase specialized sigma subunit
MEQAYEMWKKRKTPEAMGSLLDAADPVIQSAITSYAGGSDLFKGHARRLAAKAFETYDPSKGTKLRTHLMTQLQPLMRVASEHKSSVKVPERVHVDLYKLRGTTQTYFDQHGREPSDKELADLTGMSMRRMQHVRKFARPDIPESGLTFKNEEGEEEVFYPGTQSIDPQRVWIEYVHHDLAPIDQKILEWKTGLYGKEKLGTNEIAKRLGITAGAVSQRSARISERIAEGGSVNTGS